LFFFYYYLGATNTPTLGVRTPTVYRIAEKPTIRPEQSPFDLLQSAPQAKTNEYVGTSRLACLALPPSALRQRDPKATPRIQRCGGKLEPAPGGVWPTCI